MKFAHLGSPRDPEMIFAWAKLASQVGTADGWSYMGSECDESGWRHRFRNVQQERAARTEDELTAAQVRVSASFNWLPERARIAGLVIAPNKVG